jgi:phospholipid/cholesterol/gamma-HCH transport system ATP-binding protein
MGMVSRLEVKGLCVGFGDVVVQQDISFKVAAGSIFAIMGGSGCGKSTVLKAMIGLLPPRAGSIHVGEEDYWTASDQRRSEIGQGFGVLFQSGALWNSMTVAENVALPLKMLTTLDGAAITALVRVKLLMVGLGGAGETMPAELSGGMRKRAALARALALDPEILFLDEPSSGLDPITARRLDDLIQELRDGFGTTVVMVSHELPSLLGICDDGIFLDTETKTAIAHGAPGMLRDDCHHPTVHAFMNRERVPGEPQVAGGRHGER